VEEIYKALGGVPGVAALLVAAAALFWRIKVPAIGNDYLTRELEHYRGEVEAADRERQALRTEIKAIRGELRQLEDRYLQALADKEMISRDKRRCERLLKEHNLPTSWREEEADRT
jgi:septal ring factor EnvC (AmiA/AmiB activator)